MSADLVTPLCHLRRPVTADAAAIYINYAGDPEVTRYLLWRTHPSPATTAEFVAEAMRRNAEAIEWTWCILEPEADDCIGMVGIVPDGHKGELGYVLARRFWGRGIMTAAAGAVADWCFREAGLHRVWATCAVANVASARVLEKLGMKREGLLRGLHVFPNDSAVPADCYVYAKLATDR